jgi:hypothetical protein
MKDCFAPTRIGHSPFKTRNFVYIHFRWPFAGMAGLPAELTGPRDIPGEYEQPGRLL